MKLRREAARAAAGVRHGSAGCSRSGRSWKAGACAACRAERGLGTAGTAALHAYRFNVSRQRCLGRACLPWQRPLDNPATMSEGAATGAGLEFPFCAALAVALCCRPGGHASVRCAVSLRAGALRPNAPCLLALVLSSLALPLPCPTLGGFQEDHCRTHSDMRCNAALLLALVAVSHLRSAVAVTVRASTRPPKSIKRPPQFILFS